MASSPLSSIISYEKKKYDVFLSFRGKDTRGQFASYLYGALLEKQILTFMDDHGLERGDKISSTLLKAIENSTISVVIFSENYAISTWCLDELVHILECKKKNGQIVVPIFYNIDPSIVRKQQGSYGIAFAELEELFKDTMEKVRQWRAALTEAGEISGFDSRIFRREPELVQNIVEDVSSRLHKSPSLNDNDIFKGLIGIEERIKKLESSLCMWSDDVRIVGIWGMGGIGKTTLESAIYHKLYHRFEGRYCLWNVREECATIGVDGLRKRLLTELFNDGAIQKLDTPAYIRKRFRRKKVLIVLDDVDCSTNLEDLIKGYEELAPGSRIIVTSRDAQVFRNVSNEIYRVEVLDFSESLALFQSHTFQKERPTTDYTIMAQRVAYYADGNPLALRVLGSFLHSRSIEEWESTLKMLEMNPVEAIQNVLRISFEGLSDMQKEVFLDIACFFACSTKEFKRDEVERILDEVESKTGMRHLNDKSLVTICGDYQVIRMHNLLKQMGFAMVCEEHDQPGNRSRLWIAKDISHVLETASGTATIKSINLDMCDLEKDVIVSPEAFSKMYCLKYLRIIGHDDVGHDDVSHHEAKFRLHHRRICYDKANFRLHLPHGLDSFPCNKLRYFLWDYYPLTSLPSNFIPENLVKLSLRNSQLVVLWNEVQPALEKLKYIDLHGSKFLTQIPNLSLALNIETINLTGCTSLVQVPYSFKNFQKLKCLDLTDCSNLIDVEGISERIECLQDHDLENSCGNIAFKSLKTLLLSGTAIEAVSSSIGCLSGLVTFQLRDCKRLKILPTSICKLKSLESLDLSGCLNLDKFPEILEPMELLERISLKGSGIKELPESIVNLTELCELDLRWCKNLVFLPNNLRFLRHLQRLNLESCSKLKKLPLLPYKFLKLDVRFCESLISIPKFPPLLTYLDARFCENLKSIPKLPPCLMFLDVSYCISLETVSSWRTPLGHESCFFRGCSYRFDNCLKLDQNTRNNIIRQGALVEIFSAARDNGPSILFCYPGDYIPKYFKSYQNDLGTSITIKLRPNYWNANFLGFAFCVVLNLSSIASETLFEANIECLCKFKTINDGNEVDHPYNVPLEWYFQCAKLNSDHMFMLYDHEMSYKMLKQNFGANWSSICSSIVTEASFDFRLSLHYADISSAIDNDECHKIAKKCGVWLVCKEDGEQLMDVEEPEEEETRRFAQLSQASGGSTSHEVVEEDGEQLMDVDQEPDEKEEEREEETRHFAQISVVGRGSTSHEVEDSMVVEEAEEEEETSTPSFPTLLNFLKSVLKLVMELFALMITKLIPTLKKTNHIPKASTQKEQSFS